MPWTSDLCCLCGTWCSVFLVPGIQFGEKFKGVDQRPETGHPPFPGPAPHRSGGREWRSMGKCLPGPYCWGGVEGAGREKNLVVCFGQDT